MNQHRSQFAGELNCLYCDASVSVAVWPLNGDAVPFYFEHAPRVHSVEIACENCGETFFVVWDQYPGPVEKLETFDQFAGAVAAYVRRAMEKSYPHSIKQVQAQIQWGVTPLTSCFFDGCVEQAHDMAKGTKYNILSCGGIAFANAVDCLTRFPASKN